MRAATKRALWKSVAANWGYLVLALVIYGWFAAENPNPALLAVASGLIVIFALFFATTPCAALNKEQKMASPTTAETTAVVFSVRAI